MNQPVVQSLWIGRTLSVMEQLAIRSFLAMGHAFHLYTYGSVENIPAGTVVRRGDEILPDSEIFCYRHGFGKGSFAAFSNCFRYKLLLERGQWWTDLDSVCLRPLDFSADHVLGLERHPDGSERVAAGLMKAPVGSPIMEYCADVSRRVDRERVRWGQIGPALVGEAIRSVDVPVHILEPAAFYPVEHWQVWRLIREQKMPVGSHAIHLWHSQWRQQGLDPNAVYHTSCIYEQLKRRFGLRLPRGTTRGPGWLTVGRYQLRQFKAGLQLRTARRAA